MVKGAAEHLAQLATLVVDGVRAEARGLVLRDGAVPPARARRGGRRDACGARRGEGARGRRRDRGRSAGARHRRSGAAARRAGKPRRQCGEVHRARPRRACRSTPRRRRAGATGSSFGFTDSGIGLTQAEIARLFRPFAQANADVARRYRRRRAGACVRAAARQGDGRRPHGREPRRAGQHVPSHRHARGGAGRSGRASASQAAAGARDANACACSARRTIRMRASCSTRS